MCEEDLQGLAINSTVFVVWSLRHWFVFEVSGRLVCSRQVPQMDEDGNVVAVLLYPGVSSRMLVVWKLGFPLGLKDPIEMKMDVFGTEATAAPHRHQPFRFHSGFAISSDRKTLHVCRENSVQRYSMADEGVRTKIVVTINSQYFPKVPSYSVLFGFLIIYLFYLFISVYILILF